MHEKTLTYPKCPRCGSRTRKAGFYEQRQCYKCAEPGCSYRFCPDETLPERKDAAPRYVSEPPREKKGIVPRRGDEPRERKGNVYRCPDCGRPMEYYKKRQRTIRLRCIGFKLPGKPCRRKITLPNPLYKKRPE